MAVNPQLTVDGEPILQPGEEFLLSESNVTFQVESGGGFPGMAGSYYGKGNAYLTSRRIILVAVPLLPVLNGIELPFLQISGEKLNSTFFRHRMISGLVEPTAYGGLNGSSEFKIFFSANPERFFSALKQRLDFARSNPSEFLNSIILTQANHSSKEEESFAFIDPDDPTKVFVSV